MRCGFFTVTTDWWRWQRQQWCYHSGEGAAGWLGWPLQPGWGRLGLARRHRRARGLERRGIGPLGLAPRQWSVFRGLGPREWWALRRLGPRAMDWWRWCWRALRLDRSSDHGYGPALPTPDPAAGHDRRTSGSTCISAHCDGRSSGGIPRRARTGRGGGWPPSRRRWAGPAPGPRPPGCYGPPRPGWRLW